MEFELDDYRTGKIVKKVRNLNCINSTGNNNKNNYNKKNTENEKSNSKNKKVNNKERPIYVNSKNNNYLITKLKKENENLRLMLSEYESNLAKNKMKEKKIKQTKLESNSRINRKSTNVNRQQSISKNSGNISHLANNTYTNNFYNNKNKNKFNTNNNSKLSDSNFNSTNSNQNFMNKKLMPVSSYVVHNKKIVKSRTKKSLSVFRSTSKNKSKNSKNKANYKKISSNLNNNPSDNIIEIKIKEKNNINNSRIHTLNNNYNINGMSYKNVFTWKKKSKQNNNTSNSHKNICSTERKKSEINNSNSNSNILNTVINNTNRNECLFIPNKEFNLTWSRFPKKEIETSFEHFLNEKNPQNIIMSSKIKKIENRKGNKFMTNASSKAKNSVERFDNSRLKEKLDNTPQKITINRKKIASKMKNHKNYLGSNNVSMKNINNIRQKNKRNGFEENKNINHNNINNSVSNKCFDIRHNNFHEGEIYSKKRSINNDNTNDNILKKNCYINSRYNYTTNKINNSDYIDFIQEESKPEIKIIKKKINKNN